MLASTAIPQLFIAPSSEVGSCQSPPTSDWSRQGASGRERAVGVHRDRIRTETLRCLRLLFFSRSRAILISPSGRSVTADEYFDTRPWRARELNKAGLFCTRMQNWRCVQDPNESEHSSRTWSGLDS